MNLRAVMESSSFSVSPFSKYVDRDKIPQDWITRPATPSTVTNVAILPLGQSKKNIKSYLREQLFPPKHDVRAVLFKSLAKRIPHSTTMFSQNMFTDFEKECFPKVETVEEIPVPSFLSGEDDVPSYLLNREGELELRKILLCINHHFPHIVYCPILPPIVAIFLHYDDSPSQVFIHVCHFIFSSLRTIHYIDHNSAEAQVSADILMEFVKKFTPTSHKALTSLSSNPNNIYNQWLRVLFHGLPFSYLVILTDMFLIDGYKALFRAAISILKFYKKVGFSNPVDILSAVFQFVSSIDGKVSVPLLFRKAYGIKLPSTKEIKNMYRKRVGAISQLPSIVQDSACAEKSAWRYIYLVRNVPSDIIDENLFSTLYCWLPLRISTLRPTRIFSTEKHGYTLEAMLRASDDRTPSLLLIKTVSGHIIGAYLSSDWSERSSCRNSFFGTGETFLFVLSPERKQYSWVGLDEKGVVKSDTPSNDGGNSLCSSLVSDVKYLPSVMAKSSRGVTFPHIRLNSGSPSMTSGSWDVSRESSIVLPPIVGSPILRNSSPSASLLDTASSLSSVKVHQKFSEEKVLKTSTELFMYAGDDGIAVGGGNGYGLFLDNSFLNCTTEHCDTFANDPLVPASNFKCACVEVFGFTDLALDS